MSPKDVAKIMKTVKMRVCLGWPKLNEANVCIETHLGPPYFIFVFRKSYFMQKDHRLKKKLLITSCSEGETPVAPVQSVSELFIVVS